MKKVLFALMLLFGIQLVAVSCTVDDEDYELQTIAEDKDAEEDKDS